MKIRSVSGVLLFGLSVCLPQADGQGHCTLQNIAGTYAFNSTGSSTILTAQADAYHWNASYAPIARVGIFTLKPNGSVTGSYWMIDGATNKGLDPIPWLGTVVVNDDCTGVLEYPYGKDLLKEKFMVVDNGEAIRAVSMQAVPPTATWVTTARRVAGSCGGPQTVHGQYLFSCKNVFPVGPSGPAFSGAFNILMLISPSGQYGGQLDGAVGGSYLEFPVAGAMTVHDDCTVEGTQTTPVEISPATNFGKGVFFDQGRQGYFIPLSNRFPDGSTSPQLYGYCEVTLVGR